MAVLTFAQTGLSSLPVIYYLEQLFIQRLKNSLVEYNLGGIKKSDYSHYLDLQSDNNRNQQKYLTYSVLGPLLKEAWLERIKIENYKK
ncbi:hypothetical protein [Shewanella algae]|uniref:hypothetical protein n=1 Tax=Shewanella algae TaxID=38313 RepID=UPI001AAFDCA4|nr:hypothetical protein [Shewanella algae]MBO2621814.1 hypothetical protein [Shewanella algae]